MKKLEEVEQPYSRAIVQLLRGPVDKEIGLLWERILTYQTEIQDYIHTIGLELVCKAIGRRAREYHGLGQEAIYRL